MRLRNQRISEQPDYTIGHLFIDEGKGYQYFCDTMEPTVRSEGSPKIFGKTAIPLGTYKFAIAHSPKFNKDVPLLQNVPNFTAVEIHVGNYPHDTEGCLLVGKNTVKGQLSMSTITWDNLMAKLHSSGQTEWEIEYC